MSCIGDHLPGECCSVCCNCTLDEAKTPVECTSEIHTGEPCCAGMCCSDCCLCGEEYCNE